MVQYIKIFLALLYAAALVAYPEYALAGAKAGMHSWAVSVAPALLPFAAVIPYLTCDAARHIYERIFGSAVKVLFGLPGGIASAVVTGLMAGSPAGALAVEWVAGAEGLTKGQASRLAGIACGVSPVYALSVMGVTLAGSRRVGWMLVISQLIAQILTGMCFRGYSGDDDAVSVSANRISGENGVSVAVTAVMRVCGYMTVFSAGLYMADMIIGSSAAYLAPVVDLPTGASILAVNSMPLWMSAAALGFGGLCIGFQNMGVLGRIGVKPLIYFSMKTVSGIVCAGVFLLLYRLAGAEAVFKYGKSTDVYAASMPVFVLVMLPVTIYMVRNCFKKHVS